MHECPHCYWRWNRDYFYQIRNNERVILTSLQEYVPTIKGYLVYPIFKDEYEDSKGVLHWREIHYCLNCHWEFEYDLDEKVAESLIYRK